MIVALTGGTGGAKLIEGLAAEIDPAQLTIICNTGDDALFHGLHVSPDIDTLTYTLAGLSDTGKGWGIQGDTSVVLEQLRRLGEEAWFHLGDRDLATHIARTRLLREGATLSEVTERIRRRLGVRAQILPMSDARVETRIITAQGELSFQEYFVQHRFEPDVIEVRFEGAEGSSPAPGAIEAIGRAQAIIVCPSNPITSIGPMLSVPGIRIALTQAPAPVIGVSPIVGRQAISGPAHKLMIACGRSPSALGVAQCYVDFLDRLIIGREDESLAPQIEQLGIKVVLTDIRMASRAAKQRLAREVLASVEK